MARLPVLIVLLKLAGNETRAAYDGLEALEVAEPFSSGQDDGPALAASGSGFDC